MILLSVELLMKVYQVEIDPDQEFDAENVQELLAKGEEEGDDDHEVELDLTKDENVNVRDRAFFNSLFGQFLV